MSILLYSHKMSQVALKITAFYTQHLFQIISIVLLFLFILFGYKLALLYETKLFGYTVAHFNWFQLNVTYSSDIY